MSAESLKLPAQKEMDGPAPSGVVAFLLTDIEGSTRMWQQHPATMREVILRHDQLLREGIALHSGTVLTDHGEGDSFFAVFSRASDALSAARDLQLALHAEAWPAQTPIRVRMAVNAGEAGGDYRGMAANRSARVRQLATGGQVLVSQSTHALVRDELPAGITLVDLGAQRLRDVEDAEHVYRARIAGVPELVQAPSAPAPRRRPPVPALPAGVAVLVVAALIAAAIIHGRTTTPATAGRPQAPVRSGAHYTITTVAGTGAAGYTQGLRSALDAQLDHPSGLAADAAGDIFIADTGNNLIRELKPDGVLLDVAGGGTETVASGQSGVDLRLDHPTGLSVGGDGNLYIADTGNNRVLRMDGGGDVTLVAGTGRPAGAPQTGPATTSDLNAPTGAFYGLLNGVTTEGVKTFGVMIADTGDGHFRWS